MRKRKITAVAILITLAGLSVGCGIDGTLKTTPHEEPTRFTVMVSIQPPTSLRTEETWNLWTLPSQVIFQTNFEGTGIGAADDGDHATKVVVPHEQILVGRARSGGFGIALKAGAAQEMFRMGHDGPEEIHLGGATHHLAVELEDTFGGHAPHGHANVPGATIHLGLMADGGETEIELLPVQGRHGLRYEANASIPPGIYDIHARIQPPAVLRDSASKDRWSAALEAEMHEVDLSSGTGEAEVEVGGLKISLSAGAPRVYGAFGMGHLPVSGSETISFSVRLEDEAVEASGEGEVIAHCDVTATLINEETGASLVTTLSPIYGEHGFHYGANIMPPTQGSLVAGGASPGEGSGDGHSDGDSH